jgi:hypothetical protein
LTELDLELEAELALDLHSTTATEDTTVLEQEFKNELIQQEEKADTIEEEKDVKLVADESIDRFEALPRPTAIFLLGVDDMSTQDITTYCNQPSLEKVEWINDSACNLVFKTEEEAHSALGTLLADATVAVDHRTLVTARSFVNTAENDKTHNLFVRISTDEDIKVRGARHQSRYYLIHGKEEGDKHLSEERQDARKEHRERMKKSGGDGRSVFSRLGNTVERRRSVSPVREEERSIKRDRSVERDIPQHLKNRLGPSPSLQVKMEIREEQE